MDATLLITRALNQLPRQYVPSYLGLRVFAESTSKELRNDWTVGYVDRRSVTRRRQAYWKYSGLKGQDEQGKLEYRHFVVGSPTTLLAECRLISMLSQWPQFARHPAVYSYLWPSYGKGGHLFAHFFYGYRLRERHVAEAVRQSPDHTCIILDLKNFYPSVDKDKALRRFRERVSKAEATNSEKDTANFLVEQLLSFPESGLPVGPPLSHVLANVVLENVDREMAKLYPARYFRYVDDVVIVVEASKVEAALRQFRALVVAEGLAVNESKTDFVAANQWNAHVARREKSVTTDTFGSLIRRLQVYCASSPENWMATRDLFKSAGFSLPFSRLQSVATYGRFRRFLKILFHRSKWDQKLTYIFESPESLLKSAIEIRDKFLENAKRIAVEEIPQPGMVRRWRTSEIRFTFARLMYLLPFSEYGELLRLLPQVAECAELRVILTALRTGDASELLLRPGASVDTFAQLWKEHGVGVPSVRWSEKPDYFERDSAVALATYGVVSVPHEWIARMPRLSNRQLLQMANGYELEPFEADTPDYLRELHALRSGWTRDELEKILLERFNNDEDVPLFGLDIGGGYFT